MLLRQTVTLEVTYDPDADPDMTELYGPLGPPSTWLWSDMMGEDIRVVGASAVTEVEA